MGRNRVENIRDLAVQFLSLTCKSTIISNRRLRNGAARVIFNDLGCSLCISIPKPLQVIPCAAKVGNPLPDMEMLVEYVRQTRGIGK